MSLLSPDHLLITIGHLTFARPSATRIQYSRYSVLSETSSTSSPTTDSASPPPHSTQSQYSETGTAPTPSPPRLQLSYHVSRSHTNNLPIYRDFKGHGSLKLTLIRKISGDANALKKDLIEYLRIDPKHAAVVQPANHIKIKGQYTGSVQKFLLEKGF
jgi:large subunit ribosomal protein L49